VPNPLAVGAAQWFPQELLGESVGMRLAAEQSEEVFLPFEAAEPPRLHWLVGPIEAVIGRQRKGPDLHRLTRRHVGGADTAVAVGERQVV
jgi:hypothetical protein